MEIEGKSWKSMEKHKSFDFLKVNNRRPSSDDCSCAQIYSVPNLGHGVSQLGSIVGPTSGQPMHSD